jgi:hypothetical protein
MPWGHGDESCGAHSGRVRGESSDGHDPRRRLAHLRRLRRRGHLRACDVGAAQPHLHPVPDGRRRSGRGRDPAAAARPPRAGASDRPIPRHLERPRHRCDHGDRRRRQRRERFHCSISAAAHLRRQLLSAAAVRPGRRTGRLRLRRRDHAWKRRTGLGPGRAHDDRARDRRRDVRLAGADSTGAASRSASKRSSPTRPGMDSRCR